MLEYSKSTLAASLRNSERALKELNELKVGVPTSQFNEKLTRAIAHLEVSKQETEMALRLEESVDEEAAE